MKNKHKLASKDYLTIGLYTVVNLIVSIALSVLTTPFLVWAYPYATAFVLFFTCPIYILLAFKVGKRYTLLTFGIISGLLYTIMGTPFVLPFAILGAAVGELILSAFGDYRNLKAQTIAYTIYNLIYGFCNYIILAFSAEYYFSTMHVQGALKDAYIKYMTSPFWIIVAVVLLIIANILGCWFGYHLLKKHFIKSGLVSK
ncbi:MptD family putative ECF transporter S component [Enterococcus sp. DIV0876]|uniref:MptD family putative ECF transporter S component n=1 Tax=Enterococcus sp. DIV0876 TaxID=2774633 RepID=UPI003D2FAF6E